ncbi:hypothetical protein ALC60_13888 [Trachymyrmex zeteki]|uniref:Uncharacterized protein n=1 Tax=Mycetomoellerius zeteki TaxID=64791 RepID=A0A151WH46_9HYME|nr:hypothetical protein ALC60_13888 [Trachymyrmex zeteki]
MRKLIDLCVPITAESTFSDRFRGELYLGRMSRHAMKIDRRKLRKQKNLIVLRMEMETLIRSNEFCNATPFMNRNCTGLCCRQASTSFTENSASSQWIMLIFMLQRTVYLHIGHIVIFVRRRSRSSAYLPSRVLFNESVGQLSSSELSLHCDTPSHRDSRETYVLCRQYCDVCFLSWESNPLRLRCLRSLLNQPNLHHRYFRKNSKGKYFLNNVPYLIYFVIVFVLFENQSLDDTDTRFGIWHFRLIKSMISFISNI